MHFPGQRARHPVHQDDRKYKRTIGRRRLDWSAIYYHRADEKAIGFDRTRTGSKAVDQYAKPNADRWNDPKTTPPNLLLWAKLRIQTTDAAAWRDKCLNYFAQFSKLPTTPAAAGRAGR
jgi:alpha-glucuronidase